MSTAIAGTLPPGVHVGVVTGAEIGSFPWRSSPANVHGLALKVRVEITTADGAVRIDDGVDITNTGRIATVFRAAGLRPPHGDLGEHIDELVGRQVEVLTRNIRVARGKNAGVHRAVVSSWLPLIATR